MNLWDILIVLAIAATVAAGVHARRKSKKNVVVVEMRIPAGKNNYGTIEATFYAENIFETPAVENARNILKNYEIKDTESFYKFIERDDVTGCDWIRFLIEKGFLFNE